MLFVVDDRMRWDSSIDITITTERLKAIPYGVLKSRFTNSR